jgi:hypothetical protein
MSIRRVLAFDATVPEHCAYFRYLFVGFISGGEVAKSRHGTKSPVDAFSIKRREGSVARALKAISAECSPSENFGVARRLTGGTLDLSVEAFELLKDYYQQANAWASVALSDEVEDAFDFLLGAGESKS